MTWTCYIFNLDHTVYINTSVIMDCFEIFLIICIKGSWIKYDSQNYLWSFIQNLLCPGEGKNKHCPPFFSIVSELLSFSQLKDIVLLSCIKHLTDRNNWPLHTKFVFTHRTSDLVIHPITFEIATSGLKCVIEACHTFPEKPGLTQATIL